MQPRTAWRFVLVGQTSLARYQRPGPRPLRGRAACPCARRHARRKTAHLLVKTGAVSRRDERQIVLQSTANAPQQQAAAVPLGAPEARSDCAPLRVGGSPLFLRAYPKPLCALLDNLPRRTTRAEPCTDPPPSPRPCRYTACRRTMRFRPRLIGGCAEDRNSPRVASRRARARDAQHIVAPRPVTSELLAREFPALVLIGASGASHGQVRRTEHVRAIAFHVAARRPRAGDGVHVIPSWPKATALALLDPVVAGTILARVKPGRRVSFRGAKRHRRTAPQWTPPPGRQC
eukprot:scaffold34862_cov61-Phaeocystis_antarctica.AAC.9